MPFTPSHVAAVLPIARAPLVTSALALGSMAPDFPYYLPVHGLPPTHTALAIVTVDPLLAAVAFVIWHGLLSAPALAAAPAVLRRRVLTTTEIGLRVRVSGVRVVLLVVASLIIGAATHVGWDELTHHGRWGAEHVAWLAQQHGPFEGYRWAQYASGVLGAAVIGVWFVRWWRGSAAAVGAETESGGVARSLSARLAAVAWLLVVTAGVAGSLWGGLRVLDRAGSTDVPTVLFGAVTRGLGLAAAVALTLALAWNVRRRTE